MKIHSDSSQDREKKLKVLYRFLKDHKLGVIATVSGDVLPEAAVIGIAVMENLEIICSSFVTSRKYKNIQKNPSVALVIGWEKGKTAQYEGIAEELSQDEAERHLETSLEKVPSIAKYIELEHQVIYKIKPKWIRLSDLSVDPWERFEVSF